MASKKVTAMSTAGTASTAPTRVPVDATDLLYLVREGDPDPDRKMYVADLRGGSISTHSFFKDLFISGQSVDGSPVTLLGKDGDVFAVPPDTTIAFSALLTARRTDANNESAAYRVEGVFDRAGAGALTIVGALFEVTLAEDSDWTVEVDTNGNSIRFRFTGESGKTIRCAGVVRTVTVKTA